MGQPEDRRSLVEGPAVTWLVLAVTAVVVLTAVPMPHMGDQALFQLGADEILSGGVLYVDFWDLKQPGIFWFFALAEWLHVDPHVLELVWALALAALAVAVAGTFTTSRRVSSLAAVTCVAWPYAVASTSVLTQVELLAGLPMLGALAAARLALTSESPAVRDVAAILAGVSVVVVGLLKLMLLGTLGVAFVVLWWSLRPAGTRLVRSVVLAIATAVLLSSVVLATLAVNGALGEALRTWFVVPLGAGSRAGRSITRLVETAITFAAVFAPMVVLGLVGAWRLWRRGDGIGLAAVAWVLAGGATIVAQLGWYYLMSFIVVPMGLLAVAGIDELLERWRRRRSPTASTAALVALMLLALPAVVVFGDRVVGLVAADGAFSESDRQEFRSDLEPTWREGSQKAAALRSVAGPEDGVVLWGDPLVLELAGRPSAISVHGWSPEHLDQTLWRRAADEMRAAQPEYVLVDDFSAVTIDERGAAVSAVLDEQYEVWRIDDGFTWYRNLDRVADGGR